MKDMLKKIGKFFKRFGNLLVIIGGAVLGLIAVKTVSQIGKPKKEKSWKPLKGTKDKIIMYEDSGKSKVVQLPKDPDTGKQIYNDEIIAAGTSGKGAEVNVKIVKRPNTNID